jgi:hypothetical protein
MIGDGRRKKEGVRRKEEGGREAVYREGATGPFAAGRPEHKLCPYGSG